MLNARDRTEIETRLKAFGLTGQEASLYLTLCEEGTLTGYEVAKRSGISRSNAYHALSGLVDKNAAMRSGTDPVMYSAVAPDEYLSTMKRKVDESLSRLAILLPEARRSETGFFTLSGRDQIIDKIMWLMESARLRVYVSMPRLELEKVRVGLEAVIKAKMKLVIITDGAFDLPGAAIHAGKKKTGQIRIIADSAKVIAGELTADGGNCIYSENAAFLSIIKESIIQEMELAAAKSSV